MKPATYWWAEVIHVRGVTPEEKAAQLLEVEDDLPRPLLKRLALDLVADTNPPKAVLTLLQKALGLPASHEIGGWPILYDGDERGAPDRLARLTAQRLEEDYESEHGGAAMPLQTLQRALEAKLGRTVDRKTLRQWRKDKK